MSRRCVSVSEARPRDSDEDKSRTSDRPEGWVAKGSAGRGAGRVKQAHPIVNQGIQRRSMRLRVTHKSRARETKNDVMMFVRCIPMSVNGNVTLMSQRHEQHDRTRDFATQAVREAVLAACHERESGTAKRYDSAAEDRSLDDLSSVPFVVCVVSSQL